MSYRYLDLYNNLVKLTTNKNLYKNLISQDTFSERLTLFLFHFGFFLKNYKKSENSKVLQDIYDFIFKQLELTIREIGYGDQSINKKMKDYINVFHAIISELHFWDDLNKIEKEKKISIFLDNYKKTDDLVEYFDHFSENLSKKNLNSYLKSVSKQ